MCATSTKPWSAGQTLPLRLDLKFFSKQTTSSMQCRCILSSSEAATNGWRFVYLELYRFLSSFASVFISTLPLYSHTSINIWKHLRTILAATKVRRYSKHAFALSWFSFGLCLDIGNLLKDECIRTQNTIFLTQEYNHYSTCGNDNVMPEWGGGGFRAEFWTVQIDLVFV